MITIIDSIMGSGKTSWAIRTMNERTDKRFLYCTPYLTEIDRIKAACRRRGFVSPRNVGAGKLDSFNEYLEQGRHIAVTHSTFCRADSRTAAALAEKPYILIVDEALDLVCDYNKACDDDLTDGDVRLLHREHFFDVAADGRVVWAKPSYDNYRYRAVEEAAKGGNLFFLDETRLIWRFPVGIISLFEEVYLMSYMTDGSMMVPLLAKHGFPLEKKSIDPVSHTLTDYRDDTLLKEEIKARITVCENRKMNDYPGTALSKSFYLKAKKETLSQLRRHNVNYVKNLMKADAKDVMWTVFKEKETVLRGAGYTVARKNAGRVDPASLEPKDRCFVPCNARATNDFSDRHILMYEVNLYPDPYFRRLFDETADTEHPLRLDPDLYALSNMLQWIWRSAIRNGEEISIYIPSTRMRTLLKRWLDGESIAA